MSVQEVVWDKKKQQEVMDWLHNELIQTIRQRLPLERQWRRWMELYKAPAHQPFKRFPFEGAHNYMLPAIATDVDQMVAMFLQTIHAPTNLWTLEPLNEKWVEVYKPMQDFLEAVDHRLLHMFDVNYRAVLEMAKLGTAIYKTGWVYESRKIQTYDHQGKRVSSRLLRTQPFVDRVRMSDFLLPTYSYDQQPDHQGGAPWIAERHRMAPWLFKSLATSFGDYMPPFDKAATDKVVQFLEYKQTDMDWEVRKLDYEQGPFSVSNLDSWSRNTEPTDAGIGTGKVPISEIEVWEIHARAETKPGELNDIIVWYHYPSRTVLRTIYADWLSNERPYDVVRYMRGDGFWGIGVAEQKEMFQTATSDILNFYMDNMVLGNSIGIVARAGSNIAAGEPVYPGKVWLTDGPVGQDFSSFQLGTVNPNIMNAFELFNAKGDQRTGVSDLGRGSLDQLPSRTPATTVISALQEGKRRPDLTLKDMRYEGIGKVGLKVLQALQQNIAKPMAEAGSWLHWAVDLLGMPEGGRVAQKLQTPMENVAMGLGCMLTATSATNNKELDKQNLMAQMQLAAQTADKIVQWEQVKMQFPLAAPVITKAQQGMLEMFTRYLEQSDVRNIDQIIPPPESVGQGQQPPLVPGQPGQPGQPGPPGAPAGTNGDGGAVAGAPSRAQGLARLLARAPIGMGNSGHGA